MAAQTRILISEIAGLDPQPIKTNTGTTGTADLSGIAGSLALNKPGDIWSRSYGPLVYARNDTDAPIAFGTFVDGKGILCNGNDAANESVQFRATDFLAPGQTGAFMVSGSVVVLCSEVAAIKEKMNARLVYGWNGVSAYSPGDVCAIEVKGFADEEPPTPVGPIDDPSDLAAAAGVPNATTFAEIQAALNLPDTATPQDAIDIVTG